MRLEELGYKESFERDRSASGLAEFGVGRVIAEHKERYIVSDGVHDYEGEVIGNLRFTATSRADFPAVGDWVAMSEYDEDKVLIHAVLPRRTVIARNAVGKQSDVQIIAANVDIAIIVQALDRDFSLNRLERYLAICYQVKVDAVVVLTKTDLVSEAEREDAVTKILQREKDLKVLAVSNVDESGYDELSAMIEPRKTYCLLGSSGVGKSTLTNYLSGKQQMQTGEISESSNRGRHVTSHRELVPLVNGGLLIDNPGMREVGVADATEGLEEAFELIAELARECKYADCIHTSEDGCAVLAAIESEELDAAAYENYQKLQREQEHYEASVAERRKKDKDFGKMVRGVKSDLRSMGGKFEGR